MAASTTSLATKFVNRTGLAAVQVSGSRIVFSKELARPISVCTEQPVKAPWKGAFEVSMPVKQAHVAVGFVALQPTNEYLTPEFGLGTRGYISMGGAGNIYPQILPTEGKYVEGDRVRVELDLPGSGAAGTVTFAVNGRVTGQVLWTEGDVAYPAVCCKGSGEVVCDVEFLPAGAQQQ